jgi:hypothetical protein
VNIDNIEKKLREANFFLTKMSDHERLAFNDKEPFDFYLSAFLSATRTVDYRLRKEQSAYKAWREAWDADLVAADKTLIKFMIDDRNVEVHESGSTRTIKTENRQLGAGTHQFASGTFTVSGPDASVTLQTPTYSFTIAEVDRRAVEACTEYLAILRRMVDQFKADHS